MKKLLLASVAVSGLAFAAAPAHADIDLTVGGYFKGYGVFVDQDETAGTDVNEFDIIRDTEIHIDGSTTLDNGLTVGAHFEFDADQADSTVSTDESYVYFTGDWGRVNFGGEDGAGYLLQVAAPSADSNIDGLRQFVQPFANTGNLNAARLDYDMAITAKNDKFTYLSPVFSGFQAGLSYTPEADNAASDLGGAGTNTVSTNGVSNQSVNDAYELAVRYEGQFQNVGVIAGAGYAVANTQAGLTGNDDREAWNVGLDLDIGPFGIGASYSEDNNSVASSGDTDVLVVGVDYTTGPFKLGATYYNNDTENGIEYDRYTGGVTYEYGPGMSFRGSIQHLETDNTGSTADADGTALLLGTQINF